MKKLLLILLCLPLLFGSCKKEEGCTDPVATNYNSDAESDDGSCNYGIVGIWTPYEIEITYSQTGNTISFDTAYTLTPSQAEIEGNIEFTNLGTFITTSDGYLETDNYTTSGSTVTIIDGSSGYVNGVATFSVTKTNLSLVSFYTQNMDGIVISQAESINCTRQ